MVNNLLQTVGVALVAGCAWFVWPPLPLLVVGVVLVVAAEVREGRPPTRDDEGGNG